MECFRTLIDGACEARGNVALDLQISWSRADREGGSCLSLSMAACSPMRTNIARISGIAALATTRHQLHGSEC